MHLLTYCRPSFENEAALELRLKLDNLQLNSKVHVKKGSGYVDIELTSKNELQLLKHINYHELIFARQLIFTPPKVEFEGDVTDRITPLLTTLKEEQNPLINPKLYSSLLLEYPDTNEGKKLRRFCQKLEQPLTKKLAKYGFKKVYTNPNLPRIHLFFPSYDEAYIGVSSPINSSPWHMGIPRLKFPPMAPSRATLKLEEAILTFLQTEQQKELLSEGKCAVDLGAAPGGWTYQMVKRGIFVTAIDNANIDKSLTNTGLVEHIKTDAFSYIPKKKVNILICDIVDRPIKIANLIGEWLQKGYCELVIANLKLPMKNPYPELVKYLNIIRTKGKLNDTDTLWCKQLYHDRSEVTVFIALRSKS